jgi:hypothetical protein
MSAAAPPSARRPRGWGRALSPRRVRALVAVDQRWLDREGLRWRVVQIYRKDVQVQLQGPHGRPRFVGFAELGRGYRLAYEEEGSRG